MDPISSIHYATDSTFALLWEAQNRGWPLFYSELQDLFWKGNSVWLSTRPLTLFKDPKRWFDLGECENKRFDELDVVLMRKDPPVGMEYIYATTLLEKGEQLSNDKTRVYNSPRVLRDWNEKLAILNFPECIAPTIVTANKELLRSFWKEQQEIILKPLDWMGGRSIFYVRRECEPNFNVMIETLTEEGTRSIMAQRFIPEITLGDKRIFMIEGKPIPYAVARLPIEGEIRGNLMRGGQAKAFPLSPRDQWICKRVGPALKEKGLWFAGLDVIGDFLTEINITSPACIPELEQFYPLGVAKSLMDAIEQHRMCKK